MAFSNRVFYNRFCTSFNPSVYSFSFPIVFLQYGPCLGGNVHQPSRSVLLRAGVSPWAWASKTFCFTIDSAPHPNPSSLSLRRGVSPWAWASKTVCFTIDSAPDQNPSSLSLRARVSPWAWPSKTVCFTIDSAPHLIPSSNPSVSPIFGPNLTKT